MDRREKDEAFTAYVVARWPHLVRAATYLGCSPAEAEDLVQDTLVRCYRAWDKVARAARQDAYVHRVLVNGLARRRRRRWWGEVPSADLPAVVEADRAAEVDARRDLGAALAGLSSDHRTVLVLR